MKFREYAPEQTWLIPPNIEDEIPKNDIVRTFNHVINQIDMGNFERKYTDVGNIAYHPRLMLKIILYSYQQGIFSSRKIEQAAKRNIYYWYLSGKQSPNFRTICKFINKHQEEIEETFSQVLWIAQQEGLINLKTLSIDGSPIKANASKEALWDEKRIESELERLRELATQTIQKHISIDEMENKLEEAHGQIQSKKKPLDKKRIEDLLEQCTNIKNIRKNLTDSHKKKINTTDSDAVLNGQKGKPKEMCYHSNIVTEGTHQIIISADIENTAEHHLIPHHLDFIEKTFSTLPEYFLGDSAYARHETIHYLNAKNIQPVMPEFQIQHIKSGNLPRKYARDLFQPSSFITLSNSQFVMCPAKQLLKKTGRVSLKGKSPAYRYSNPMACHVCPIRKLCTTGPHKILSRSIYYDEIKASQDYIKTTEGYELYKKRMGMVEPVFGNIKWNKGFKFTFRGLSLAKTQFKLACIMHNLEKFAKAKGFAFDLCSFPNIHYNIKHRRIFLIHIKNYFCDFLKLHFNFRTLFFAFP